MSTHARTTRHTVGGASQGIGTDLLLVADLVELLRGVVAGVSDIAIGRGGDGGGLLETTVLERALRRKLGRARKDDVEAHAQHQCHADTDAEHRRHRPLSELRKRRRRDDNKTKGGCENDERGERRA